MKLDKVFDVMPIARELADLEKAIERVKKVRSGKCHANIVLSDMSVGLDLESSIIQAALYKQCDELIKQLNELGVEV